jgi:Domain of unknown function (DUF4386)
MTGTAGSRPMAGRTEMTNLIGETPPHHVAPDLRQSAAAGRDDDQPIRRAALVAGVGLMLMAALAGVANILVLQGLITPGDAVKTAADITGSETAFRLGVVGLYVVAVLDVVIAWALRRVFNPVNRDLSRLAAWLRLAYAGVFLVALSQLAGIPPTLNGAGYSSAFTPEQRPAQALLKIDTFNDVWSAGLILFALHLVLIGYLAYRSGYVPRLIGVLLVIAGIGYAFDSVVTVFSDGSPFAVSTVTFLGEFLLGVWLLVRGRRLVILAGRSSNPTGDPR